VRHIGFLGASQPAVEGLNPLKFSEDKSQYKIYEFKELDTMKVNDMEKKLAWYEKLFAIFQKDISNYTEKKETPMADEKKVEDKPIEKTADHHEAMTVVEKEKGTMAAPKDSGPAINADIKEKETKDSGTLDTSKVQAAEAKNDANEAQKMIDELKAKIVYLESQVASMQKAKGEEKAIDNKSFCEQLVKEGKLRPADVDMTLLTLNSMADLDRVNDFSEKVPGTTGGVIGTSNKLETLKKHLSSQPKIIEFGEFPSLPGSEETKSFPSGMSMTAMIEKKMKEKQDKLGLTSKVSYWGLMKECMAECSTEYPEEYSNYAKSLLPTMPK
jgi:hypothetical protein